jgi:4-hydroxythreonine-4-phosphate dehydrogenase
MSAVPSGASLPVIAVTAGEPAGIGPDLCVMLARRNLPECVVVIADRDLLAHRAAQLGVDFAVPEFDARTRGSRPQPLSVYHVPLAAPVKAGELDRANGEYVLQTLRIAADGCLRGTFAAMVTAPVNKAVINDAGVAFTGHTEFLAEHTSTPRVVMMLVGGGMRVALATTHLALRDVPAAITRVNLIETLTIVCDELKCRFGIARPRVLVAGLNPHAGELGREEIEIIGPALEALRAAGRDVIGPLPADTLFNPARLAEADAVLAMYHDQGLPVLKHASFGAGVNVTLGLPIIRTSVDHGTALDIAGTGRADAGSLIAAIELAADLARRSGSTHTVYGSAQSA